MSGNVLGRALGRVIVVLVVCVLASCSGGERPARPSVAPTSVPTVTREAPARLPFPAPGTAALATPAAAALQAVLERVVELYRTSPDIESAARGITAAVVTDRWAWAGAAGVDGAGVPLGPTTVMAAASITKTFVAAEVLRLAEARRIDLDAPLGVYVRHPLTANGATVRQHLAMRAGLPDFTSPDFGAIDRAVAAAPSRHWSAGQALAFHSSELGRPDEPYTYSNPSYLLLGMLIEAVAQQPLAAVLRRDLVAPAGLPRFALQDGERPEPPLGRSRPEQCRSVSDGYLPCRALASLLGGAGAMAADAPTVARWGYQLYGSRVVPREIVDEMTGGDGEYGLGTMLYSGSLGLGEGFGHRGDVPGYSSLLVVIPEYRTSVAILLADGNKNVSTVASRLLQQLQQLR